MAAVKESANQLEQEHRKQMEEAMEDLQRVKETHKKEIEQAQEKTKQQSELERLCHGVVIGLLIVILLSICSAASDRLTGEKCQGEEYRGQATSKAEC
jgi:F0F1-type ATP synthase assembly protein I